MKKVLFFLLHFIFVFWVPLTAGSACFYGWGKNDDGSLMTGTKEDVHVPSPIAFGALYKKNVTHIAAGSEHSMAVDVDGVVYSFGNNDGEQLGVVSAREYLPVPLTSGDKQFKKSRFQKVHASHEMTFLQDDAQRIRSFGNNEQCALGDGTFDTRHQPMFLTFSLDHTIETLSVGQHHTLYLTDSHHVWCSGDNRGGACGLGEGIPHACIPKQIDTTSNTTEDTFKQVSAGAYHSLLLSEGGTVYCFGSSKYFECLGSGEYEYVPKPLSQTVLDNHTIISVSAGNTYGLALTDQGVIFGWGYNRFGTICATNQHPMYVEPTPFDLSELLPDEKITQIEAGNHHNLFVTSSQNAYACGTNSIHALGVNSTDEIVHRLMRVSLPQDTHIKQVALGDQHSLFLSTKGVLYAVGSNSEGQCGQREHILEVPIPTPVDDSGVHQEDIINIESNKHTSFLSSDGSVYMVGDGKHGELGTGGLEDRSTVFHSQIQGERIYDTSLGNQFSLFLSEKGHLYSTGRNDRSQLGLNVAANRNPFPIFNQFLSNTVITSLCTGYEHSLVLSDDGYAYGFGSNRFGALGLGSSENQANIPTHLNFSREGQVSKITCGGHFSIVLLKNKLFSFGYDEKGSLGQGDLAIGKTMYQPAPVVEEDGVLLGRTIEAISSGDKHTVVLADGMVFTFGDGSDGQGGRRLYYSASPGKVELEHILSRGESIIKISAGPSTNLLLSSRNQLICFGLNLNSHCGLGPGRGNVIETPELIHHNLEIPDGRDVRIFASRSHSFLSFCPESTCFGLSHRDPRVCSRHGKCHKKDNGEGECICTDTGFTDEDCSDPICFGLSKVNNTLCSSHGQCVSPNECLCEEDYIGSQCNMFRCGGIRNDNPLVCSGHGTCVDYNQCECESMFYGNQCEHNNWWIVGLCSALFVFCLIGVCVTCVVATGTIGFRQYKRMTKERKAKEIHQSLLQGFVQDQDMDDLDADSRRAKLIVRESMLEIDFKELSNLEKIASGGSGATLYSGYWNGTAVAVKIFRCGLMSGEEFYDEFEGEVSLMSAARHRNVINFYGCSLNYPRIAIVMELCRSGSLETLVINGKLKEMSRNEVFQMLVDVAEGMHYLHSRGVIHRDLKCANVLVDEHGVCKITDFGLAKFTKDTVSSNYTSGIGTSYYMAPELDQGQMEYNESVDVYAFGILAMEVLSNRMCPFPGISEVSGMVGSKVQQQASQDPSYRPDVSTLPEKYSFLQWMLKSCWEHDPNKRPPFRDISKILKASLHDTME